MKKKTLVIILAAAVVLAACILPFTAFNGSRDATGSPATSDDDSTRKDKAIEKMLAGMSVEEKVGQLFMGCFYSDIPSSASSGGYELGCVLLFGTAFDGSDKEDVTSAIRELNEASDIPPLVAVDEEGGTVNRVSSSPAFRSEPFKSPRELYASGGMKAVISDIHEKNALLTGLGINLNLAPVLDISTDPNDFMYPRSLGQDAEVTSEYAKAAVAACLDDNEGCCLKHFPGYGNSADTHNGIAVDSRSAEQIRNVDMLPFEAGVKAGAPAVLVSHSIVSAFDPKLPASLSPAIHEILRDELDFDGVIITDDLSMGAIAEFSPDRDCAVAAILAGNDMLCTGDFAEQCKSVTEAVINGTITEKRLDNSVRRILKWKMDLGLNRTE